MSGRFVLIKNKRSFKEAFKVKLRKSIASTIFKSATMDEAANRYCVENCPDGSNGKPLQVIELRGNAANRSKILAYFL